MRHYRSTPFRCLVICATFWALFVGCVNAQRVTEEGLFRATGKLYSEAEADVLIKQGKLATTAATAAVPIVFNREGRLLTAKEFNTLIEKDVVEQNTWDDRLYKNFYTDFTTYRRVLRKAQGLGLQSQARVNLVKDYRYVMPPPNPEFKGPYLFDPFQKFYQTWDEIEKAMERKTRRQSP